MHLDRLEPKDAPLSFILCPECDNEHFELHENGEVVCGHCGTPFSLRHDGSDEDTPVADEGC